MTIEVKVVASSVFAGSKLVTLEMRYPRFIHAEFMTHRMFSRNASSSRARPVAKVIEGVVRDPAIPVSFGKNQPGMQAGGEHNELVLCGSSVTEVDRYGPYVSPEQAWCYARDKAVEMARNFANAGYHKEVVNRILEPFDHISVIVTATDWANFFDLRCHRDADPTMRALAEAMRDAYCEAVHTAEELPPGHWHLPYVTDEDFDAVDKHLKGDPEWSTEKFNHTLAMISAARCARVSYLRHDGSKPNVIQDFNLAARLREDRHLSPFEHAAQNNGSSDIPVYLKSNFTGPWAQFRKYIESEY